MTSPGFVGLGVMGLPMAGHLLRRFESVYVYTRTRSKAESLLHEGAVWCSTPASLASRCSIVGLCLPDTPDVEVVLLGENGLLSTIQPGSLIIDFSTISPSKTEEFADLCLKKGTYWIDAPVSGGDVGARNATLTIMAGGAREGFDKALPFLETLGKKVVYTGASGSGQRTKLANNIAVLGTIVSMAESLGFAQKRGLNLVQTLDVISSGAAGSWTLSNYGPRVLNGDFTPGFMVELMAKDLRLAIEELDADANQFSLLLSMKALFDEMIRSGEGRLGIHAASLRLGYQG